MTEKKGNSRRSRPGCSGFGDAGRGILVPISNRRRSSRCSSSSSSRDHSATPGICSGICRKDDAHVECQ